MTLADLLLFLVGDSEAIRRLASDPWTTAVGAILVLSAALARHHDTHDLRRQWWRLLIPFAASTLAAGVLFLVVVLIAGSGIQNWPLGWSLLGLFWLTAPFAWLYGVPFERLWPKVQATRARRLALAAVATARVTLMTCCVSVLLGYSVGAGLLVVLCFAIPVVLFALAAALLVVRQPEASHPPEVVEQIPLAGKAARRVVDSMSGVSDDFPEHQPVAHPPGPPWPDAGVDDVVAGVFLGCLGVLVLLGSSCLLPLHIGPPPHWPPPPMNWSQSPPSPVVWAIGVLTVLFWLPALAWHQPAQQRRTDFVERLRRDDPAALVHDLAQLSAADFPPGWDPATVLGQSSRASRMLEVSLVVLDLPASSWVRAGFLPWFGRLFPDWVDPYDLWLNHADRMPPEWLQRLERLRDLLRHLPETQELLHPFEDYLIKLCEYTRERDPPRAEILQDILTLALKRGSPR